MDMMIRCPQTFDLIVYDQLIIATTAVIQTREISQILREGVTYRLDSHAHTLDNTELRFMLTLWQRAFLYFLSAGLQSRQFWFVQFSISSPFPSPRFQICK